MSTPGPIARAPQRLGFVLGAIALLALGPSAAANAQGLVQGVQQGAREGSKAAGPVGGVLGGAIGGVVGVVGGVVGAVTGGGGGGGNASKGGQAPAAAKQGEASKQGEVSKQGDASKQGEASKLGDAPKSAKGPKAAKSAKAGKQQQAAILTQTAAPQLTAEQIVASSDANIERIKKELNLTPEQEKHWAGFNSAMHYLGNNGADRLNLRVARAKRDPPDDIIEQMRNEAQFLNDRAVDQRNVADAAEPLFASLDDKQKKVFIQEMVNLSHERGLD